MQLFFISFALTSSFTMLGETVWLSHLHRLRDELLTPSSHEVFIYILLILTGASILVPQARRWPSWFASTFVLPSAGAISGWGAGLTLLALVQGDWRQFFAGVVLTLLATMLTLSPVLVAQQAGWLTQFVRGRLFQNRAHARMLNALGTFFIVVGGFGLQGIG